MPSPQRSYLLAVLAGILLFTFATAYLNWVKFVSLRSTWAFDLAFFNHNAASFAQGRTTHYVLVTAFFDEQDHDGPSFYRSTHFHPVFWLIAQVYRLRPDMTTLMAIQSLAIASGALPLFFFTLRKTSSPRLGALTAFSYLLHPAVCHLAFNDFRTISLGMSPALFALWAHDSRRPAPFALAAFFMLSCRPEYLFLLAGFGFIHCRPDEPRRRAVAWALAPLVLAALWAALTCGYYLWAYDRPWPLFAARVSGSPLGNLPGKLLHRLPTFFRIALLPALMALLAPRAFLFSLLFIAGSDAVQPPAFPHHGLQQLSPALAATFWGFASAVARYGPRLAAFPRRILAAQALLALAALGSFSSFAHAAFRTYLSSGYPRYEVIQDIRQGLPGDATVLAAKGVLARFSDCTRVLTYQGLPYGTDRTPPAAEMEAILEGLIPLCDLIATEDGDEWIDERIERSGRYAPARRAGCFHLFVARKDAPRPADPDRELQRVLRWDQMRASKRRGAALAVP